MTVFSFFFFSFLFLFLFDNSHAYIRIPRNDNVRMSVASIYTYEASGFSLLSLTIVSVVHRHNLVSFSFALLVFECLSDCVWITS